MVAVTSSMITQDPGETPTFPETAVAEGWREMVRPAKRRLPFVGED